WVWIYMLWCALSECENRECCEPNHHQPVLLLFPKVLPNENLFVAEIDINSSTIEWIMDREIKGKLNDEHTNEINNDTVRQCCILTIGHGFLQYFFQYKREWIFLLVAPKKQYFFQIQLAKNFLSCSHFYTTIQETTEPKLYALKDIRMSVPQCI
ncbi:hypothetical protein GIB67_033400, partial [Kingdonia uniflora]